MTFITHLNQDLEKWFLLQHPFYKAWNDGQLTIETLALYAREYYHHVAAFPRYISQIHSLCEDIEDRQVLLDNLMDEEIGDDNHPELWLRFAEGICHSRNFPKVPQLEATKKLVEGFFDLVKKDYWTGLGALYAYERQMPSVSKSKIEGLKTHYNIHDSRTLQFFTVHNEVDVWHTAELVKLIRKVDEKNQQKVHEGATQGAKFIWEFLDGLIVHAN